MSCTYYGVEYSVHCSASGNLQYLVQQHSAMYLKYTMKLTIIAYTSNIMFIIPYIIRNSYHVDHYCSVDSLTVVKQVP